MHIEIKIQSSFSFAYIAENRYKHEAMVEGEPVLFELLDTCPKVSELSCQCVYTHTHIHLYWLTNCRHSKDDKSRKDIYCTCDTHYTVLHTHTQMHALTFIGWNHSCYLLTQLWTLTQKSVDNFIYIYLHTYTGTYICRFSRKVLTYTVYILVHTCTPSFK